MAQALDLEADLSMRRRAPTPELQARWAEIGQHIMNPDSLLYKDLIADIEVSGIPLDPRLIDQFI